MHGPLFSQFFAEFSNKFAWFPFGWLFQNAFTPLLLPQPCFFLSTLPTGIEKPAFKAQANEKSPTTIAWQGKKRKERRKKSINRTGEKEAKVNIIATTAVKNMNVLKNASEFGVTVVARSKPQDSQDNGEIGRSGKIAKKDSQRCDGNLWKRAYFTQAYLCQCGIIAGFVGRRTHLTIVPKRIAAIVC